MGKSYKYSPYGGNEKDGFMKKYFNRSIRHKKDYEDERHNPPLKRSDYKKVNCSWAIYDYWSYCPFEEFYKRAIESWYRFGCYYDKPFPDRHEEYMKWFKWYRRK